MNPLTAGVVVFVVVTSALSFAAAVVMRRARDEGLAGTEVRRRVLPLLLVDGLFTVLWVVWLLGNL